MTLSRLDLDRAAASTGFQAEPLEKVFRLLDLTTDEMEFISFLTIMEKSVRNF